MYILIMYAIVQLYLSLARALQLCPHAFYHGHGPFQTDDLRAPATSRVEWRLAVHPEFAKRVLGNEELPGAVRLADHLEQRGEDAS